jgi:Tfp pilus assembly PilM family ATPase
VHQLKACLGVDLGASSVKVVELKREKAGVRVTKTALRDLGLGPTVSPEERAAAQVAAVREILKEEKIATKHAVFAVPGQAVFVKRVRLPRTSEERLHRIINYEARQQIPFPLEQTMLEFQIFDEPGDPQVEVLMVAIKRDFIDSFMKTVHACKLTPVNVSVHSLAVFNFNLFNIASAEMLGLETEADGSQIEKKGKGLKLSLRRKKKDDEEKSEAPAEDVADQGLDAEGGLDDSIDLGDEEFDLGGMDLGLEDVKAYLHIGASALDIVISRFGERKFLGFTRSVPVAGNEIARAIQSKLGLASFQEAERVKRTKTAIAGDDDVLEDLLPGGDAAASEAASVIINRIVAEVRRTLDFYVSQPDGVTVDSIVLTGGSARLPNLQPVMEEKLGILTEMGGEVTTEHLLLDSEPADGWSVFSPSVGMALTGLGLSRISVDFLPTNLKDIRQFKSKGGEVGILAACLAVSVFFGMQMGEAHRSWYEQEAETMQDAIDSMRLPRQQAERVASNQETIAAQFEDLALLTHWRDYWPRIYLEVVHQWKPPQVTLTDVRLTGWGHIVIRGYSTDSNAIATYASNIVAQAGGFISVEVSQGGPEVQPVKIEPLGRGADSSGRPLDYFELWMQAEVRDRSEMVALQDYERPSPLELQQQQRQGGGYYGEGGRRGQGRNRNLGF